ncbi:hypothetical protein [Streptomyces sp. ST2-7A]|uniref:hypothetical protein n=1 Tax=Streptomyces sp. ST2-7A TaxID=2907214 RepID=UPI001F2FEDBD|nr:hypothetical protein [Streptomyces sp. ST2-7A]MCE7081160.1 hypothetical protein [Streptomyces sp. ST2-7A]
MRLTVTAGDRQVDLRIKGNSLKALRRAEKTARRLLAATGPPPPPERPFGFALGSDTERAPTPAVGEEPEDEE